MKRTTVLLALAGIVATAVAGPALAQRGASPAKGPEPRWEAKDGGKRGGMEPMEMRGGRPGARLLGPEGRLLRDPGRMAEELKLTAQQREKLEGIGEDLARQVVRTRADLRIAGLDLARDLRRDSPSRSEIDRRIEAISKLEANLMRAAVTARLDARNILTAEQRRQLTESPHRGAPRAGDGMRREHRAKP